MLQKKRVDALAKERMEHVDREWRAKLAEQEQYEKERVSTSCTVILHEARIAYALVAVSSVGGVSCDIWRCAVESLTSDTYATGSACMDA